MNLIVALMITKVSISHADTILLERRVEEISEITQLENFFKRGWSSFWNQPLEDQFCKYPDKVSLDYDAFECDNDTDDTLWTKAKGMIGLLKWTVNDHATKKPFKNYKVGSSVVKQTLITLNDKMERERQMMREIRKDQTEISLTTEMRNIRDVMGGLSTTINANTKFLEQIVASNGEILNKIRDD